MVNVTTLFHSFRILLGRSLPMKRLTFSSRARSRLGAPGRPLGAPVCGEPRSPVPFPGAAAPSRRQQRASRTEPPTWREQYRARPGRPGGEPSDPAPSVQGLEIRPLPLCPTPPPRPRGPCRGTPDTLSEPRRKRGPAAAPGTGSALRSPVRPAPRPLTHS